MKKCPDCGMTIANQAIRCPKCKYDFTDGQGNVTGAPAESSSSSGRRSSGKGVGALFQGCDDVPIALHDLPGCDAQRLDVAGVGGADDAAKLVRRIFAGMLKPRPGFCHGLGIKPATCFASH